MLEFIQPEVHRTLKFHQYIVSYTGLIKLKRALRRYVHGMAISPLLSPHFLLVQQLKKT